MTLFPINVALLSRMLFFGSKRQIQHFEASRSKVLEDRPFQRPPVRFHENGVTSGPDFEPGVQLRNWRDRISPNSGPTSARL